MSGDKYRAALDAAAKQLSYRALSAKMLRDKLLGKGHDEEAADYALAWLTERRLLDELDRIPELLEEADEQTRFDIVHEAVSEVRILAGRNPRKERVVQSVTFKCPSTTLSIRSSLPTPATWAPTATRPTQWYFP